jgi:predicted PurR-regulated permease PerM
MKTLPEPGAATLLVVILSTCLLLYLFQQLIWLVLPVLLALLLYYCLRPGVDALVVRGMRRETAVKAVCLLQAIVAAGILVLALLYLAKAGAWQSNLGRYLAGGQTLLSKTIGSLEKVLPMIQRMNLAEKVDDEHVRDFTDKFVKENLLPITLELLRWLPSLLLVPYITYFMLTDGARLKKYVIKSVPNAFFEKALLLFSRLDASLQNYFQGLLVLTFLDAACLGLGLGLLGIANAIWLGLAAAVLAWIPYLGSVAGCIMVVLVAATDFPDQAWTSYACLGLFLVVRLLDDFVFLPLTIGRKLNVHPLLSVLMLMLGVTVGGATGLVFALPLFGVLAVIGETVSQVVTDQRLRARYRGARQLAASYKGVN